jgi:hypothetical protein
MISAEGFAPSRRRFLQMTAGAVGFAVLLPVAAWGQALCHSGAPAAIAGNRLARQLVERQRLNPALASRFFAFLATAQSESVRRRQFTPQIGTGEDRIAIACAAGALTSGLFPDDAGAMLELAVNEVIR